MQMFRLTKASNDSSQMLDELVEVHQTAHNSQLTFDSRNHSFTSSRTAPTAERLSPASRIVAHLKRNDGLSITPIPHKRHLRAAAQSIFTVSSEERSVG